MAKKNNKARAGYFQKQIQQYGVDFLRYKNAKNLENDSIMIFRELASGSMDIDKYGDYLLDNNIITACLISAQNKYNLHLVSFQGVNLLINNTGYGNMNNVPQYYYSVLEYHKRRANAYLAVINGFNAIKVYRDKNILYTLTSQLSPYRNDFYN